MSHVLLQAPWNGVQQHFTRGGSLAGPLYAILAMAALAVLLWFVHQVQQQTWTDRTIDDSKKLFRSIVRRLKLTVPQRDLLYRMTRDLPIEHPTLLLISPRAFADYTDRWTAKMRRAEANSDVHAEIDSICRTLFDVSIDAAQTGDDGLGASN